MDHLINVLLAIDKALTVPQRGLGLHTRLRMLSASFCFLEEEYHREILWLMMRNVNINFSVQIFCVQKKLLF